MLCSLRLAGAAPFLASLDQGCARRGPRARAQKRRAGKNKQKIRKSVRGSWMKIVRLSHPCPPASKRGAPSFAMGWGVLTDPERVAPVDEGRPPARTGFNAGGRNEAVCSVSRPGWRSTSLSAPRAPDTDRARLLAGGTSQVAPRGREQGEQQAEGSAQAECRKKLVCRGGCRSPKARPRRAGHPPASPTRRRFLPFKNCHGSNRETAPLSAVRFVIPFRALK